MKKAVGAVILLLVVAAGVFLLTKKEKKSELKEVIVKKVTTDRFIESIKVEGDIEIKKVSICTTIGTCLQMSRH